MARQLLTFVVVGVVAGCGILSAGCESDAQTGALLGTAIGAAAGQAIGGDTEGTLIGAGAGAAGGYMIGNESDKQRTRAQVIAAEHTASTATVNITNSNGSITPVILRKNGNMWVGPKGEQYMSFPTAEQLKPVYGF